MQKLKREEAGSLSKSERQKLQKLYTQGGGAYGSVRNLLKASNPSVSKVKQFSHSKPSYTKFTLATRKFKRMKAFARFRNEIWCMELAYIDKLAKDKNGVKHLLVRQDLFDRTVDAKRMKTKYLKETVRAFLTMITKKKRPKKFGLTREQNLLESLKNYAKLKENKYTLQWVRPRLHLLNVQYDPWKEYFMVTWKTMDKSTFTNWLNSLQHNSWRSSSIDLIPKNLKNSDFLSILYSEPLREFRKPKFIVGDRIRISKCDLPFRKGYKPQFTKEVFEIVAIFSKKPPTYTIKDEQDETIRGNFYQKKLIKVIYEWNRLQ